MLMNRANRISVRRVLCLCYSKRYVGIFACLLLDLQTNHVSRSTNNDSTQISNHAFEMILMN